jgi:hypothetical protein
MSGDVEKRARRLLSELATNEQPKPFNVIIVFFKDTLIPGGRLSNIGQS